MMRWAALPLVTAAACVVLPASTAAASPEGDAADAITAAWERAGGEKSELGAKQGDTYPVAEGFVQDFAGGKIFFTPATGATAMYGAVLDKYESLGGPAGSDLGFPTIDEVPGLAGPDSRVSIFSASDTPVIFWTPDHGAFVVRGAINAAWDKLGSSAGVLGVPVGEESYEREVATQAFSGGSVSWNRLTKAFTTAPPELAQQLTGLPVSIDPTAAVDMAWRAAGGPSGPLGAKQGGQYPVGADGLAQDFAGGKVFFSPVTGANAIEGDILAKYESLGGPVGSDLGFPTAAEADGGIAPTSRISTFSAADRPVIFWTPDHGAFVVRGAMRAAWDKLGGPTGALGAPVGDQTVDRGVVAQKFAGGTIAWDRTKNTFSTEPANLASSLTGLQVPGQNLPAGARQPAGSGAKPTWHWWWLLVAIPVLLGIVMIMMAGLWWRQRRAAGDISAEEPDRAMEAGYGVVPVGDRRQSAETDSDLDPSPFSTSARYEKPPAPPVSPEVSDQPGISWMPPAGTGVAENPFIDEPEGPAAPHPESGYGLHVEDSDKVNTAPNPVQDAAAHAGRHSATDSGPDPDTGAEAPQPSAPRRPAIHLPLDDPHQAPYGYPIKGNVSFGLYYTPDSTLYDGAFAEIWFTSEETARSNGFTKADHEAV
jgi:uncharacterized protein with LGFP repeats